MTFLVTAIRKVEREYYDDIIFRGGQVVEIKPAPIIAFFDVEILIANETMIFEAEIRKTRDNIPQIDWDDELGHLIAEHSKYRDKSSKRKSRKDNERLLAEAILDVNNNEPVDFPILIETY